jgi:hypothetical protein
VRTRFVYFLEIKRYVKAPEEMLELRDAGTYVPGLVDGYVKAETIFQTPDIYVYSNLERAYKAIRAFYVPMGEAPVFSFSDLVFKKGVSYESIRQALLLAKEDRLKELQEGNIALAIDPDSTEFYDEHYLQEVSVSLIGTTQDFGSRVVFRITKKVVR